MAKIKTKAEVLATSLWKKDNLVPPIQVQKIAESNNIDVLEEELEEDVSGMMVTREDHSVVIIINKEHRHFNSNGYSNRQRFSIAHELGHFFMHRAISPIFVDSNTVFYRNSKSAEGTQRQEIEANAFAAELLMPEEFVRKLFPTRISPMDTDKIESAAKQFEVSSIAMSIRLERLDLIAK